MSTWCVEVMHVVGSCQALLIVWLSIGGNPTPSKSSATTSQSFLKNTVQHGLRNKIFLRCDKLNNYINVYKRSIIVIVTCTKLCVIFGTGTYKQYKLVYIVSMMTCIKYLS